MMSTDDLKRTAALAREVAALADQHLTEVEDVIARRAKDKWWPNAPVKTSAALRRRSMDLTRALADLRRAS